MSQRRSVAFAAAGGTLLATAPLSAVFANWTWVVQCVLVVAAVCAAGIGSRALRAQPWVQLLAMLGALLIMVTWLAHGPGAIAGTIPTKSTFIAFGQLLGDASADIRKSGLPVPDDPGLLFLVSLGVGLVAVLVDVLAVGLQRPAMAGFPMLAIYAVPVFVHTDSVSPIPFVAGAAGFLWLLGSDSVDRVRRFGRRFTGEGRGVDLWEPSPLASAGRRLAVLGVVFAVALPLLIPGMTTGFLESFNGSGSGLGPGNGTGGTVNLFATLEGNLHQAKSFDMLKVTTDDPNPYYIRFATADDLTPQGFKTRALGTNQAVTEGGLPDPTINASGVSQKRFHASVVAVDFDMRYLPVYRIVEKTQKLDGTWLYDTFGDQVYSLRSSTKGRTYSFDYIATDYSPAALRLAPALGPTDSLQLQGLAKVPQQREEINNKVHDLIQGKGNEYDKVMAIYTYFSSANGFKYSLSTKPGTSGSDIVDFAIKNKQGYCEQYAAAMAWMVRTAGYPARVAFGFTRGNRDGHTYTLTNLNLHAWTEVFFPSYGWVPFDATPTLSGTVTSAWAPDPNHPLVTPSGSSGTGDTGPGSDASDDPGLAPKPRDPDKGIGGDAPLTTTPQTTWWWYVVGGAGLLLVLLCVPGLRRAGLRRRRLRTPAGTGAAVTVADDAAPPGEMRIVASPAEVIRDTHAAWDEFLDTLIDFGIPIDEAQTPRETVRRIAESQSISGAPAQALQLLGRVEERARYARTPLAVSNLGTALREIRAAVAARAGRRTRLRAALLPPSVLQRWRAGIGTGLVNTINGLNRAWETAARAVNPRRLASRSR